VSRVAIYKNGEFSENHYGYETDHLFYSVNLYKTGDNLLIYRYLKNGGTEFAHVTLENSMLVTQLKTQYLPEKTYFALDDVWLAPESILYWHSE
jgi:hypothetical protein